MHKVAVVRLVNERLAWYPPGTGEEARWLDDPANREALAACLAQRDAVCFAAPAGDVRLLALAVTPAEKKHIDKSLPFMLEEQVAADIDTLHFAFCALGQDQVAVAVCARERMQHWGELLADFPGIQRWLPEPLLLPWRPGEWCLLAEGGGLLVRSGRCEGFGSERELAPALLQAALEDGGDAPDTVVVYGEDQAADLALLPESLRQRAQWRRGNLADAMRLSEASPSGLNLLQGEYAPRLPLSRWWRQWRALAATFAAVFLLQLLASYADYRSLRAENLALRSAVQESFRQAVPRGQVVDAEKQLRRQLDALRGTGQSSGFVSLLEQLGGAIADLPNTTVATMNYNDRADELRMNILAQDFEGVEKLRRRIDQAGLEAVMESSSTQGDAVRARLRVGRRS